MAYHPTADNKIAGSLMTKDGEQMDIKAEHLLGWTVLPVFEGSVVPVLCADLSFSCERCPVLSVVRVLCLDLSSSCANVVSCQWSACCVWICPLVREMSCVIISGSGVV